MSCHRIQRGSKRIVKAQSITRSNCCQSSTIGHQGRSIIVVSKDTKRRSRCDVTGFDKYPCYCAEIVTLRSQFHRTNAVGESWYQGLSKNLSRLKPTLPSHQRYPPEMIVLGQSAQWLVIDPDIAGQQRVAVGPEQRHQVVAPHPLSRLAPSISRHQFHLLGVRLVQYGVSSASTPAARCTSGPTSRHCASVSGGCRLSGRVEAPWAGAYGAAG